jgi:hypothetical protein
LSLGSGGRVNLCASGGVGHFVVSNLRHVGFVSCV